MDRTRFLSVAGIGALAACAGGNSVISPAGLLVPARRIGRPDFTVCNNSYGIYSGKFIWEITDCGLGLVFSVTLAQGVLSGWYVDAKDTQHNVSMNLAQWNNGPPKVMKPDDLHKATYDGTTVTLTRTANGNKVTDGAYSGQTMMLYDYINNQQH